MSHRDDGNNETIWDFNERDLCTLETYPDAGTKSFEYDLADNVTGWEDPNGTAVEMAYDDAGRKTSVAVTRATGVLGTTAEAWVYDALDRVVEATENDVTVLLAWDSLGRKTSEVSGPNPISTHGKTTSYTYDAADNLTGIVYPVGSFSVTRTVDDLNRLTLVEDGWSADIVAIEHDTTSGRLKKLTFGNLTTSNFACDGFGRVTDIDHTTSTPTTFAAFDIGRDDVGNIVWEEWTHASGKGNNHAYDRAYRLTKALPGTVDPSAEHASPGSEIYDDRILYNLSDDSDRTSVVTNPHGGGNTTVSYTSNNVHEYTVIESVHRTYDTNGNLTDDGTREYQYDYRNQLVKVTEGETVLAEYEYDALGRRTKTTADSAVTRFYHDGVHEIAGVDGSGNVLRKYVYRDDIDSIAMMEAPDVADLDGDDNTTELVRLYYHVDPRTNVAFLTDASEDVVESYEYDPYGNTTIRDQAGDPVATSPVGNQFTFQRRRLDAETGLYYFRARHYDAVAGQWLQRDPLGLAAGGNPRLFVSAAPTARSDAMGTEDLDFSDALAAAVAGKAARRLAAGSRLDGEGSGPQAAFRHCLWQCVLTRAIGADKAETAGNAYEAYGTAKGQPYNRHAMGHFNNRQGRRCGETRAQSCIECCWGALWDGELYLIPPDTGGGTPTPPPTEDPPPPDGGGGTPTPPPSEGPPPPDGGDGTPTPPQDDDLWRPGKTYRNGWPRKMQPEPPSPVPPGERPPLPENLRDRGCAPERK